MSAPSERRRPAATDARRDQLRLFARRVAVVAFISAALIVLGAVGLAISERVDLWFAFRWALDTASTEGGFAQPRTVAGQLVEVALIIVGVGTLFYALAIIAEFFAAGHLAEMLADRRTQRMIDSLNDHHIICGFGRVGVQVARDLQVARAQAVVIDLDPEHRDQAQALGFHFVQGDASDELVLQEAGIERARSIVACSDSDAVNVFIALTARELRADISIVARAASEDTEKKLRRAGADRVISPYKASGTEMARLALHRQLSGAVDVGEEYRLEEIVVGDGSGGVGQSVGEVRGASMIVGLRRGTDFQPQPAAEATLQAGDVILAMGSPEVLDRLEDLLEYGPGSR
jgi:voltage-gated potassium channel